MAWFRLDRLAKKNREAAPAQAKLYLRQFLGAMLPMLVWTLGFTPLVVKVNNSFFYISDACLFSSAHPRHFPAAGEDCQSYGEAE